MPIETDADRAAFVDGDEFASAIAWVHSGGTAIFTGIFDAEFLSLASPFVEGGVEGSGPQFIARTSDIPATGKHGDAVAVTNPETLAVSNFKVVEFKPDGTGMTVVRLQEA